MYPTLFTIGNLSIPTYTVLLDLGLIFGLLVTYFEGKRVLQSGQMGLDVGLWVVIGGIIGGRIGYVVANWSAFSEDWLRVFRIWEGGLSFHGALLGGLLVLLIFSLIQRKDDEPLSFWVLADVVTPGLALGIVFGWAACLMGGCAYGAVGQGFGYAILPDIFGLEAPRFATQVIGFAFSLVLFFVIWFMRRRWPYPGASFLMYLMIYCGGQFFLEFTRGDEAIFLGPWRLAQWLDLVLALVAAGGLLALWWRAREADESAEDSLAGEAELSQETEGVTSADGAEVLKGAEEPEAAQEVGDPSDTGTTPEAEEGGETTQDEL
jgi:phosphatidylglycerol:prolipoprotein diacylglycerol transferase